MPTLQFKGKTAVETYHHTVPHHTFDFDSKLSVLGKCEKPSLDGNLIIEGDNLLALKALLPTHAGRIKCIYIDPPYNTGNEGWIYNDNLTQPQFKEWIGQVVGKEEEDACRHDKWCCMMYPRLQLLKDLLHDEGAIFISIDDNELKNLLFLCDEIFDSKNRFGVIIVENNPRGRRLGTELAVEHEYVVVYARQIEKFKAGRLELNEEQLAEYAEEDSDGRRYRLLGLRKRGALARKMDRPNLHFALFVNPKDGSISLTEAKGLVKIIPKLSDGTDGVWRWSRGKIDRDGGLLVGKEVRRRESGKIQWDIFEKDFAETSDGDEKGRLFPSIWQGSEFNNETGRDQIKEVFGAPVFDYPKPVDLIKHAILLSGATDGIVLDSFSGSGTTGQAVIELNEGGKTRNSFILVQQPYDTKENEADTSNTCRKVTAERVRRVIAGNSNPAQTRKIPGIPTSDSVLSYARLSAKPLFGEYREFGENPPPYEDIAKYVFYTETSRQWIPKGLDKRSRRIGEHNGTSYYLLYSPNQKTDRAIDAEFLKATAAKDPNTRLVVYAEKIWLHRSALREWEATNSKTVRTMIVPFNLR